MSTVCVLTPIVIGSWPMITSAVVGAASAMGFAVARGEELPTEAHGKSKVEVDVPNSEVIAESLQRGEKIRVEGDGVAIEFGVDERGALSICVTGEGRSKAQLRAIGDEIAGRVVQQFAYHKLMTELKQRKYNILDESVQQDDSIQVRIKMNR
jgi:hypothetical protein